MTTESASSSSVFPMTLEQEAIWLDDHLMDGPSRYLESWVCEIKGAVDRAALHWALNRIVERHEALRTRFVLREDRLLQVIMHHVPVMDLERKTCSAEALDAELRELVRRPMDVAELSIRATLVDVSPDHAVLVVQVHHIVIDDWALQLLGQEFEENYRAFAEHRDSSVASPPLQPGPYAVAQRAAHGSPATVAYWRETLRDLPPDFGRTLAPRAAWGGRAFRGGRIVFDIDAALAKQIRAVCRRLRVTPFAVLSAVVVLLLHTGTGADDVVVGTPVSHRGSADDNQVLANLSDLLPLRLKPQPDTSFGELVRQVRTAVYEAIAHQNISYPSLLKLTRGRGRRDEGGLCRTAVVVDDGQPTRFNLPGITCERKYVYSGMTKFDLSLTFVAHEQGYFGFLEYETTLFSQADAERVLAEFMRVLELATADPDLPLALLGRRPD
jgi:Condensation domain